MTKKVVYSYLEGDKPKGRLLFTDDKDLIKKYPKTGGISQCAIKKDEQYFKTLEKNKDKKHLKKIEKDYQKYKKEELKRKRIKVESKGKLIDFKSSDVLHANSVKSQHIHSEINGLLRRRKSRDKTRKNDRLKKVIVIGNSPSILSKKYGKIIDSHDIVIRMNKCPTEGYEKYIGSRTDIWATSDTDKFFDVPWIPKKYSELSAVWLRGPRTPLVANIIHSNVKDDILSLKDIPQVAMYKYEKVGTNGHGVLKITDYEEESIDLVSEPCTGLLTILTAAMYFEKVSILGFTFNIESDKEITWYYREKEEKQGKLDSKENHYAKRQKGSPFTSEEQAKAKIKIIKDLVKKGKIKIINKDEFILYK